MPRPREEIDPNRQYSAEELIRLKRNERNRQWYAKLPAEKRNAMKNHMKAYSRKRYKGEASEQPYTEGQQQQNTMQDYGIVGVSNEEEENSQHLESLEVPIAHEETNNINGERLQQMRRGRPIEKIDPNREYSIEELKRLKRNERKRQWYAELSVEKKEAMKSRYQRQKRKTEVLTEKVLGDGHNEENNMQQPHAQGKQCQQGAMRDNGVTDMSNLEKQINELHHESVNTHSVEREQQCDAVQYDGVTSLLNQEQEVSQPRHESIERHIAHESNGASDVSNQVLHWNQQMQKMERYARTESCSLVWNRECPRCHAPLLTGEPLIFCCNNGHRMLPPLPAIPAALARIYAQQHVSKHSRRLNRLFCFTALCVEGEFVALPAPSSVAMMGRTYHQLFPASKPEQPLHWYLHDENERLAFANRERLPMQWVMEISTILNSINPYCQLIRRVKDMKSETALLKLNGTIATGEVAAIVHANNTVTVNPRSIVFWLHREDHPVYISILDRQYEPLQYPLLFPHGTQGWHPENEHHLSQIDWYRCRLLCEPRCLQLGRLTCEYIVDMYSRVEEEKLNFIATNGYSNRRDSSFDDFEGDEDVESNTTRLPASFLGSRAWCSIQIADALALARAKGRPTFFITMTTNPDWPEIQSVLKPGQTVAEIPTIVVRSFHARLRYLKRLLHAYFGPLSYIIHVIEFQKRGLPHAHLIVKTTYDIPLQLIDSLISAEVPADPILAQKVRKFMIHHHSTRCQTDGGCCWHYPRPINPTTHLDSKGYVQYRRRSADDVNVVPYSPFLLEKLDCHINVDIAATVHIFMYLYAYIYKGCDKVYYQVQQSNQVNENSPAVTGLPNGNQERPRQNDQTRGSRSRANEISDYIKARYISATEGAWRIFRYHISEKDPGVRCLPLHFQERQSKTLRRPNTASELDRYFLRPQTVEFDNVKYIEYYESYTLLPMKRATGAANEQLEIAVENIPRFVVKRRTVKDAVCRIRLVLPHNGEIFYLRQLLLHTSPRSWSDLKIYNGQAYSTYQETVTAIGLLQNETEYIITMEEAISYLQTPTQLRFLFSLLILDGAPALDMWERYQVHLVLDFLDEAHGNMALASQQALITIESILKQHGTTVTNFGLPKISIQNQLVIQELLKFPDTQAYTIEAITMRQKMNSEQARIYDYIMSCSQQSRIGRPMFIDGKAGAGKTFLLNAVCFSIRGQQCIILPCASTALAALLYPGGRTAHSLFEIPVTDNNIGIHSMINSASEKANLIREAKVIIWDEFPMANKAVIESVNLLLQTICDNNEPFGGKCFVAAGDFRQIAPIVEGAGKQATLDASIKSSQTWSTFQVHHLHQQIRHASDPELGELLSSIGESWSSDTVTITIFATTTDLSYARDFLFPAEVLANPALCEKRAFLSPLNLHVDDFNKSILDRLSGDERQYFSCDYVTENDIVIHDNGLAENDFLHSYDHPTLPKHTLHLKKGAICQIIKLLDKDKGLVKNARVVIHELYERYVTVRLLGITSTSPQYIHPISRVNFFHKPQNSPFTIHRRQLPLRLAYSTTFHSCLGLTLDRIVLDLRTEVFAHGQLYTALTRIRHRHDVLILQNTASPIVTTRNVVFKELLE